MNSPTGRPWVVHEEDCPEESSEALGPGRVTWRTLVSGDRTPSTALTAGVAEVAPGGSGPIQPHHHPEPEVYYVVSGCGEVYIDGVTYPLRPGSAVFIPGGAQHTAINTADEVLRLFYVFPANAFGDIEYTYSSDY